MHEYDPRFRHRDDGPSAAMGSARVACCRSVRADPRHQVATVALRTRPENVAARRTAERVGFVDEGTVPGDTTMQLLRYRAADAMPHDEQERATSYRVMGGSTCLHL